MHPLLEEVLRTAPTTGKTETQSGKSSKKSIGKSATTDDELANILESVSARILVVGVGGAGNNAVTRLMQVGVEGAETLAANTDAQDL
ncbi:MAG: cell division protein FtsZ, partial [Candidatus Thorarchaeota archaeon]